MFCPWEAPKFIFYSLDPGIPRLLYYAYIPIIIISIFFALFVFIKDRKSIRSFFLLLISLFFAGFILNAIFQWTSVGVSHQMFSWQLNALFEPIISILVVVFLYLFLSNEKVSQTIYLVSAATITPIIVFLPTIYNVKQFYLTEDDCGGVLGLLWTYIYVLEILAIFAIVYICYKKYVSTDDKKTRSQIFIIGIYSVIFLSMFTISNIAGELTKTYQINLIGPIGMVVFLGSMAYIIVNFQAFNIKLLGTQALLVSQGFILVSLFFIRDIYYIYAVIGISLILFLILGILLVRGVRQEVVLRESLEEANQGQSSLIHFMNHQIKGRFGNIKNVFAELLTDDYGAMPLDSKPLLEKGLDEANVGVNYVQSILRGASAESGQLQYDKKPMDMKIAVENISANQKEFVEQKGLKYSLTIEPGEYTIMGDTLQLGEAIKNLIDNSVNYTPTGSISVILSQKGTAVLMKVVDTGFGISEADKPKLFKSGGRGADSLRVNVNATGYGLVFVKNVVEAHGGKVWFESAGRDKGSTFYLELPKN